MADSSVTDYVSIDEEFPIAGQDNDSQGFRDNFAAIKQSLANTSSELSSYLTNGAKLNVGENNFQGNIISNARTRALGEVSYLTGNISNSNDANSIIDWTNGSYQKITMTNDTSTRLLLTGWPLDGTVGKMRLELKRNTGTGVVEFTPDNAGTLKINLSTWKTGDTAPELTVTTNISIVDVYTTDGGITVFVDYVGDYSTVT